MKLTLPYPPSVNRIWRHNGHITYKTDEARDYRYYVIAEANRVGLKMLAGEVALTIRLFPPRSNCDIDNALKVLNDALQGIAFENDKHIVEMHIYKRSGRGSKATARVEVEIKAA